VSVEEVLKVIVALGDLISLPIITERSLRSVVNLPAEEEKRRVDAILTDSIERKGRAALNLLVEILLYTKLRDRIYELL